MSSNYQAYLQSKHWREFRELALDHYGHKCTNCGLEGKSLDVHHLTYERRGCELLEDVTVLCRSCHLKEHETEYITFNPCPHNNKVPSTVETGRETWFTWWCKDCQQATFEERVPSYKELIKAQKNRERYDKHMQAEAEKQALKEMKRLIREQAKKEAKKASKKAKMAAKKVSK